MFYENLINSIYTVAVKVETQEMYLLISEICVKVLLGIICILDKPYVKALILIDDCFYFSEPLNKKIM